MLLSSLWVAVQGRGREEEGEGIGRMRQGRLAALWEDERERWARSLAARVRESAGWASGGKWACLSGGLREAAVAWADCCEKAVLRLLSFFFFFQKTEKCQRRKRRRTEGRDRIWAGI